MCRPHASALKQLLSFVAAHRFEEMVDGALQRVQRRRHDDMIERHVDEWSPIGSSARASP